MLERVEAPDRSGLLPERFHAWFARRGWTPRAHQLELLEKARAGESVLLIAPTGAGKTLAGFLPSLVELAQAQPRRLPRRTTLHTLYVSPLKALAIDIARNVERPVAEMGLPVRIETRTGDTSASKRMRQRRDPPDVLLTTPEQIALLIASPDAPLLFAGLRRVVLDELHSLVTSKRGDLLALGLARLRTLAPQMTTVGLSATVRDPNELRRWLVARSPPIGGFANPRSGTGLDRGPPAPKSAARPLAALVLAEGGAKPEIEILETEAQLPWAGHSARHATAEIYDRIKRAKMTLVFVNTRAQAEVIFAELWRVNEDGLPIALHHGSLDVGQRRRVENAMAAGSLKAVVCTSTLDLGIDWGDVDVVIHVGAPKGASRLLQRIGRANHRLDEPSRALLVPANRFEVLECLAARDAAAKGAQDTPAPRAGALDVLAQHILGTACAGPFDADALFREVTSAAPYAPLARADFDAALAFAATGGYALKSYDRFAKIRRMPDGLWRIASPAVAQQYRLNVGTIVEDAKLKVRLVYVRPSRDPKKVSAAPARGGRRLGEIEEYFLETLRPGETFLFGGEVLALQAIAEDEALVVRARSDTPQIPSYMGGKFPLSTYLAARVRALLADPSSWRGLPDQVRDWLELQRERSALPPSDALLVETFPRGARHFMVAYPFEGRLAHQTLGMLLTRRMERAQLKPLGFVANDYALAVWSMADLGAQIENGLVSLEDLFAQDMLGDDLEEWLRESALMKRMFRGSAIIAGLIERRFPGKEKTGRQLTVSTDLLYDVLLRHEPDHILIRAARADAATGLLDVERLGQMLSRVAGRIAHRHLEKISPLAVPVMLEIGREPVYGEAQDAILAEAAEALVADAMRE